MPAQVAPVQPSDQHDTRAGASTEPQHENPQQYISINDRFSIPRWIYALLWLLVFALVLLYAALLGALTFVYLTNRRRHSFLWIIRIYFLYSEENAFLLEHSTKIGIMYGCLCAGYLFFALRMVRSTIKSRRVGFGSASRSRWSGYGSVKAIEMATNKVSSFVEPTTARLQHWRHDLSVQGRFFEMRLLLDEAIEVVTQVYAAYTSSLSISNQAVNLTYGVVIFVNGISTMLIHRKFRDSLIRRRVAWLLTDFVLDFMWGTVIPTWMSIPLVSTHENFLESQGDSDATTSSTREVQRVVILSWISFLVSIVPFCNSFFSLAELVSILHEQPTRGGGSASTIRRDTVTLQVRTRRNSDRMSRWMHVVHLLSAGCGLSVLIITLVANGAFHHTATVDAYDCLHRVHPWFSTKEACLGRRLNCSAANITGSIADLTSALSQFDEVALSEIIIRECPAAELPPTLTNFPRLILLSLERSKIESWPIELAISTENFQHLKAVYMSEIILGDDAPGLTGVQLSPSIEWIAMFSMPNASKVLSLVENTRRWKDILYLNCDTCELTTFPAAVYEMPRLLMLTLSLNDIDVVPDEWVHQVPELSLQSFWMFSNPRLQSLPDNLWTRLGATTEIINLVGTNLSLVPSWLPQHAHSQFKIDIVGTPFCTHFSELSADMQAIVHCTGAEDITSR